jgi:hypothetical protein
MSLNKGLHRRPEPTLRDELNLHHQGQVDAQENWIQDTFYPTGFTVDLDQELDDNDHVVEDDPRDVLDDYGCMDLWI